MNVNEKLKAKAEFNTRRKLIKALTWQGIIWNSVGISVWMDLYYPNLSYWWKLGVGAVVMFAWVTWFRWMTMDWEYSPAMEWIAKKIDEEDAKKDN